MGLDHTGDAVDLNRQLQHAGLQGSEELAGVGDGRLEEFAKLLVGFFIGSRQDRTGHGQHGTCFSLSLRGCSNGTQDQASDQEYSSVFTDDCGNACQGRSQ